MACITVAAGSHPGPWQRRLVMGLAGVCLAGAQLEGITAGECNVSGQWSKTGPEPGSQTLQGPGRGHALLHHPFGDITLCWPFPPVFSVPFSPGQFEIMSLLHNKFWHVLRPLPDISFLFTCHVCLVMLQYLFFNYLLLHSCILVSLGLAFPFSSSFSELSYLPVCIFFTWTFESAYLVKIFF